MAHRGKFYPVAFRRDFNEDCNIKNITALADKYILHLNSANQPPYPVDGTVFHLDQLPQPDPGTLAWGQTDVHVGPDLWSVRMRVEFSELPDSWLRATWFLFKYEFLASSWRGVPRSREDPLDHGSLLTQQVLFTDFSVFPHGANFNNSTSGPAGY